MADVWLISSGIVAPFLVVFRESIEAALIIGIIWAYLDKIEKPEYQKYLLYGSAFAVMFSIFLGGVIVITLGELSGFWKKAFEGVASITATFVLTYVIIWMSQNAQTIKNELEGKIAFGIVKAYRRKQFINTILIISFVTVAREGLETILFLTPLLSISLEQTLIGSIFGIIMALILSLAAKRGIYNFDTRKFFSYTSIILVIFAAGLFGYGIHESIEAAEIAGIEHPLFAQAWDINPESQGHPLHEKGIIGSFAKALFGYDGNPEILRVFGYVGYWLVLGLYLRRTYSSRNI